MTRSVVLGCGGYLPARVMLNDEMAALVDTTDDWIVQRTGIRQRHLAADGELTSDLAVSAARVALANASVDVDAVDLIIVATATPDQTFPATATTVQAKLGVTRGTAFDVQAVCSGFVHALAVADSMVKNGLASTALVIGAETFSRLLDWTDRATCVLFGDGAGAVVIQAQPDEVAGTRGILGTTLHADGRLNDLLYVDGGPSSTRTTGLLRMRGREVYRHAVVKLASVVEEVLQTVDLKPADIDWVIPHQANSRIIEHVAKAFAVPSERVILTVDRHANTSAASIPLALATAVDDGRIQRGELLLLEALGGGLTWGANVLRW